MGELRNRKVLVTGAASGIGREVARICAREGAMVLAADLEASGLGSLREELVRAGCECHVFQLDVSDRTAVERTARLVEEEYGPPDVLVNVAGVFCWAFLEDTPYEDWEWVLGVNLWGPIHTVYAFLPGMLERRTGHIVNVASMGGLMTVPATGAYCTSKFALVGFTESLQMELWELGIAVTLVCPGSIRTPIIDHIRVRGFDYGKLKGRVFPIANRYPAEKAAAVIVKGILRDRSLVLITPEARLLYWLKRLSPNLYRWNLRLGTKLMKLMR